MQRSQQKSKAGDGRSLEDSQQPNAKRFARDVGQAQPQPQMSHVRLSRKTADSRERHIGPMKEKRERMKAHRQASEESQDEQHETDDWMECECQCDTGNVFARQMCVSCFDRWLLANKARSLPLFAFFVSCCFV